MKYQVKKTEIVQQGGGFGRVPMSCVISKWEPISKLEYYWLKLRGYKVRKLEY